MKPAAYNHRGFSIVEVLIASAILSITIIAVVAMIRKGTDIQLSVKHRQAARAIINSRLETRYGFSKFNTISTGVTADSVAIDSRAGDTLKGFLTVNIADSSVTVDADAGTALPIKRVLLLLVWMEFENELESVSFTRWVTE